MSLNAMSSSLLTKLDLRSIVIAIFYGSAALANVGSVLHSRSILDDGTGDTLITIVGQGNQRKILILFGVQCVTEVRSTLRLVVLYLVYDVRVVTRLLEVDHYRL